MDRVTELSNEDIERKKFQVFKNVSIDRRAIAVIAGIAEIFCYNTKYKAVFTFLKFFYLVTLIFKESLFLAIVNISEVHSQGCGKYFYKYIS